MAYSDYGGYAYRNGVRVEDRSDCTITPEGDTYGTPGSYPGFALLGAGMDIADVKKRLDWPSGHAVLGDGPIYVVLYKQSALLLHRGPERLNEIDHLSTQGEGVIETWVDKDGKTHRWIDTDKFKLSELPCEFLIDGVKVTVFWRIEDNHYQYVKVEQPDGVVWTGWSGYGVGAGLEDAGYGYSTEDREDMLAELFPAATPKDSQ